MKLPTSLVAVKKITSSVARSSFLAETIEKVAQLMIRVEGTINPIILRRTSLESYEVVEGHFEYYAAVRAREISPLKGEMIQAIILEPENEEALLDQITFLRKSAPSAASSSDDNSLEMRFANLEKMFQAQFEELRKDNRNLQQAIEGVSSQIQTADARGEWIDAIANQITEALRPVVSGKRSSKSSTKKSVDDLKQNPLDLNSATQAELETVPGVGSQKAIDLIKRRENKPFSSIAELAEVKGISKSMIDRFRWQECFTVHTSNS
ncbi:MAG: helix-hairpin-helix domain-containing protein [Oculatellaceae cyanobacterium Prado106]|jgi:DNA uptake protein ComE-like DNA-binding protein|nr:helix-hairpin-helix domain-containing protein [Oculatellaceae cyanobacterium Prado106]